MSKVRNNFPLFPISLIVYPGEIQPLHIFESRYKQLISEVKESGEPFGIPFVKDGEMCKYGSAVVLHKILATSPSGEMDVLVKGVHLFMVEDVIEKLPEKLYGGGRIRVFEEMNKPAPDHLVEKFTTYQKQLADINSSKETHKIINRPENILELAGQLPLDIEEKYELIKSEDQTDREKFLHEKLDFLLMINQKLVEVGYRFYLN